VPLSRWHATNATAGLRAVFETYHASKYDPLRLLLEDQSFFPAIGIAQVTISALRVQTASLCQ
jgi:hypothetical protein